MSRPTEARLPTALLAGGLAALALGSILAFAFLPEWRERPIAEPETFAARFLTVARQVGLNPAEGVPKVQLLIDSAELSGTYRRLGERAARVLAASRGSLRVRVSHPIALRPGAAQVTLRIDFAADGGPLHIELQEINFQLFRSAHAASYEPLIERFERALLRPGERTEPPIGLSASVRQKVSSRRILPAASGGVPARLEVQFYPPVTLEAERTYRAERFGRDAGSRLLIGTLVGVLRLLIVVLIVFGAFFALLARRSLDILNAALLAGIVLVAADFSWTRALPSSPAVILATLLASTVGRAVWVLATWSAGESLLRVNHPGFTTSLDQLRRGRLGPRSGRALLAGLGCGAGIAGLKLALGALAVALPGISPAGSSLELPLFRTSGSLITDGILLAAHALLALGLAARFLPARWVVPATALALAGALEILPLHPGFAGFFAGALVAVLLAWAGRRLGLTTLLVAALASYLLPAALFAGRNFAWMSWPFGLCAALTFLLAGLGLAGLRRPEDQDAEPLPQPAFMRRLEEERRVRYEVGLLGKMQAGLTPRETPCLPGYEIAARSALAGDAGGDLYDFVVDLRGGVWVAAGDVAGNGYPCAVAQAMIKATLLSVIGPEASPEAVLLQTDRVLRRAHLPRRFSTLVLLRLDPASGEIVLSNAGHPYPLLVAGQRLSEIEIPGLPLGRGPERTYGQRRFTLPPGGLLVLYSDGIADTLDRSGSPYGFERVLEVVTVMGSRPAPEVVDALLNDARRHLEGEPAADDMTVVAIRRS